VVRHSGSGDGPVDAAFKTISLATGVDAKLCRFEVRSLTEGEDAQGEAIVHLTHRRRTYRGSSVSTNIVESSAMALLEVINQIELAHNSAAPARREGGATTAPAQIMAKLPVTGALGGASALGTQKPTD
jgi:2-isopropylmalate synthase